MLRAKIETSVNSLSTRSERKVPTTAIPPIASGSEAAHGEVEPVGTKRRRDPPGRVLEPPLVRLLEVSQDQRRVTIVREQARVGPRLERRADGRDIGIRRQ